MRKTLSILIASLLLCGSTAFAQTEKTAKDREKERQELAKSTKKQLNEKATKAARDEAKQLKKEGWKTSPGALPIEKQLDKSYLMQYEYEGNEPKYIMAEAMSTAGNYDAAKMQALELAKQNLAGQIQTEVTALIDNTVSNAQLTQGDVETITRSIMASKNLISQSLGRTNTVVELYRVVNGNNREVMVRLAYDTNMAKRVAMKAVREDLQQRGDSLHNRLDQLLGW